MTPADYPAECSITAEELAELREAFLDDDSPVGEHIETEWPPRDAAGNVYPIWFTLDNLDDYGKLRDSNSNPYDPFSGNLEPITRETWGACNAPLANWRDRYPQIRFCGRISNSYSDTAYEPDEYTYCPSHKGRDNVKTAEEQMQTGMYVKSVDHLYAKLDPWKKLVGWGTFESLMGESTYEFAEEYEERQFDFSEEPFAPDGADEDGILMVECGYPTQYVDRALSLYVAAMKTVQMITVQPRIMHENLEAGEGMMETKSIEKAQLTAPPSEHDPSPQEFKTIETWNEHHLNLPLSRVITDRPKLLEYGGVTTDAEKDEDNGPNADNLVLEIDADAEELDTKEDTGTDPNQFENYTSESQKIVDKASNDE